MIRKSNVAMLGTADDPVDSLEWHEKLAAIPTFSVKVCPSSHPDKAINIHKGGWIENGEHTNCDASLKKIVEGFSFDNAPRNFDL